MRAGDAGRLVLLAAIWGASFLFTRVVAPAIGPVATADSRMLIGGGALAIYFAAVGFDPQYRRFAGQYAFVGMLNTGLPFLLYSYAALELSAGMLSVLNATSPMWGALMAAALLRERLSVRRGAGLALGVAGVALLARPEGASGATAIAAGLGGAFLYGLSGVYLRRWASHVPARGMAVGTQLAAGLLVLPLLVAAPPEAPPAPHIVANVIALGLLCSAIAYVLYFRLVADIGAAGALTVTYLIPAFGVLWGMLFLGEAVSAAMLAGAGLVIVGTVLVLRN